MPYYFGEDMEEYWDYVDKVDADPTYEVPESRFKYVEPWQAKTTVLPFPETPGPEPERPRQPAYSSPARKPGLFARLFGQPAVPEPPPTPEQMLENFRKEEEAGRAHTLWKLSKLTARCRDLGVKRVFGSFDGGGDESFTYFQGIEMSDGRVIPADLLGREAKGVDCEQLVEDAAYALMGGFDSGGFELHGVLTVDFDACTITDEKNADVVLGDKMPWEV